MSLVNDMLNDLEQRRDKAPPKALDLDWLAGQSSPKRSRRKITLLWPALVLVLLVAAIAIWMLVFNKAERATVSAPGPAALPAPATSTAAATTEAAAATEPAAIETLQWSNDSVVTRLRIGLSAKRPYSISRQGNKLLLHFYDIDNQLAGSALLAEPPVRSVAIQRQGGDVVATLAIDGEYSFSDKLLSKDGTAIEISIRPAPASVTGAAKPVKAAEDTAVNSQPRVAASRETTGRSVSTKAVASSPQPVRLTLSQRDLRAEKQARDLLREGESYRAQSLLETFVDDNPGAPRSTRLLATLWLNQERFASADELLQSLVAQYPDDIEARILRARSLMAQDKNDQAVDWLMRMSPDVNLSPQYYEVLGLAARRNQQYGLSEQAYRGLIATDAARGDWLVGLGIALDAQARISDARDAYQRALATRRISAPLRDYAQRRLADNQLRVN